MIKPAKSSKLTLRQLNHSLHDWWKMELDKSRVINKNALQQDNLEDGVQLDYSKDPSLAENTYLSFDEVVFDERRNKTWVRFGLKDHILWLEETDKKNEFVFNEFVPETTNYIFYYDFREQPIPVLDILKEYFAKDWKPNPYFELPMFSFGTNQFKQREKPDSGIQVYGIAKKIIKKDDLNPEFLNEWRLNIFKKLNGFYSTYKYNFSNDYQGKHKPSVENGFIAHFDRTATREKMIQEILNEEKQKANVSGRQN